MRVERVVVVLLLLVSQGDRLGVIAIPGERPKDRKTVLGRIVLAQEVVRTRDEKKPPRTKIARDGRAWGSQVERVTAAPARREPR